LRPAGSADLARLVALERASFGRPWTDAQLAAAVEAGQVDVLEAAGAGVVAAVRSRRLTDEMEIDNVVVAEGFRRQGLALDLLRAVLARARGSGIVRVFLEVRESNRAALALYRRLGFRTSGRRPGYYTEPREDALLLALELGPDPTP
jgi:ribosomal-protein-alanine N-acetyltransferase